MIFTVSKVLGQLMFAGTLATVGTTFLAVVYLVGFMAVLVGKRAPVRC